MLAARVRWMTFAAAWAVVATPRLGAQVEERQRPFDSGGRILVLTPPIATRLGVDSLLPIVPSYRLARLYQRGDSSYVLEFVQGTGALEQRIRYDASAELVGRIRARLGERQFAAQSERRFQEGRAALIRNSVVLGLGFYGWAIPEALDVHGARNIGSMYLLTASASFFVPFLATKSSDVSSTGASLYWYGATRGIGVGLLASDLADRNASSHTNLTFALGGSVLGFVAGVLFGRRERLSHAEASAAMTFGDLGVGAGINTALASGLYGASARDERGGHAIVLGGLAAGLALGPVIARHEAYGDGDPQVVLNGAVLGLGAAGALLLTGANVDDHVVGAALFGGELIGAFGGNRLARRVTLTDGQGTITGLAMLGGGLLGAGLVYVVAGEDAEPEAYLGAGTAGGAVAMLLVLNSYRGGNRRAARNTGPQLAVGPGFLQLRF
jgi:hypothetical protein